jgi:hypothetical protein
VGHEDRQSAIDSQLLPTGQRAFPEFIVLETRFGDWATGELGAIAISSTNALLSPTAIMSSPRTLAEFLNRDGVGDTFRVSHLVAAPAGDPG